MLDNKCYIHKDSKLTATTPALAREGKDEHTLSSEACAVSRPLFFTLRTHHAATQELQHQRTTQLSGSLQASPQAPGQTTGVAGAWLHLIPLIATGFPQTVPGALQPGQAGTCSTMRLKHQAPGRSRAQSGCFSIVAWGPFSLLAGEQADRQVGKQAN
ncbi:UNVERIFIED_CONTAM: hypothetical protein FKN15_057939 [Acipenser sinensis]